MEAAAAALHLLHCGGFGRVAHLPALPGRLRRRGRTRNDLSSTRFGGVSKEIQRVRKQMEQDEQLATLMRGLRVQNLRDEQFADDNVCLRLVEVETADNNKGLPLVYNPEIISAYWGNRPRAVATRVVQLLSVAGGFISNLISDLINKKLKENEVARAIELREIVTSLGPAYIKLGQVSIDVVGLVDEWAARFFEELDYVNEGENGTYFAEMMKEDLPQLLDTGFFHADPHPGNMIRTPDGKLAILDFGLVTKLTDDQKYGMIEAIAHLIHRDYDAIVKDFVKLGFIPEGVNLDSILPVLAKVFDQALEEGGAKNINFQELAADLAQITFDYPFRIPPYFALIIRAIGVLEGIALVGDPEFTIVDEAYPYIAQRLLTDESPRLRSALCYTMYGKTGVFDAERFIDVMQAFENFIRAAKSGGGENLKGNMAELADIGAQPSTCLVPIFPMAIAQPEQPVKARAALAFLLSERGNFFREFILDEIVKAIDAVSREQLIQIAVSFGIGNATPVFSMVPVRARGLLPTITEEDRVILNNVEKVVKFLTSRTATPTMNGDVNMLSVVQELLPVLPGISSKILPDILSRLSSRVWTVDQRGIFVKF
ncbi:hypothetical protein SETIT_9G575300v2 [Setaria italica]|uniref:ABC1 atypical kinase-like domain-containing protein n=1 Tax=Setaria italica TaxID=4555 RepID=A0A368SX29_SETIT|nr:hypothetical protein SETIT_9G575300v2 [Setaria italica]